MYISLLGDPEVSIGVPRTGGYNKTVRELLDYFSNSTKLIFVITNKNRYNSKKYSQLAENIKIIRIDFEDTWELQQDLIIDNINSIFQSVIDVIDYIKTNFDISLIHSFYWLSGIITFKIKEKYNTPFIHTVISLAEDKLSVGILPHTSMQRQIESEFLSETHLIFAITPEEKRTLIEKYNIPEKRIVVVGRSVNENYFDAYEQKLELQSYDKITEKLDLTEDNSWWVNGAFLYVGRIVEIKGIEQIVKAWIRAKEQYNINIPLWIVGGVPNQITEMRQRILFDFPTLLKYEQDNEIIWWGTIDSSGISTLMRKSQALIMHSKFEAGGRVIIEALSAGIPVIATPFGYGKDYIYEGYNGFVVNFDEVDRLSKIMMRFSDQPYLSSVLGNAANKFIKKVYNNWNYFKKHSQVYESFLTHTELPEFTDNTNVPDDLNSFKIRNCVTAFPFYDTDRNITTIYNIISKKINISELSPINNPDFHSNIYLGTQQNGHFYLKCFYHILADNLSKVQYKNVNVISAQTQVQKSLMSTSYSNIAKVLFTDISNLLYAIPRYKTAEIRFDILASFWKEALPEKRLLDMYYEREFSKLESEILNSDNSLINGMFCAETAYKNLFFKYNLPVKVDNTINKILKSSEAVFGLNYGKGILGHAVLENGIVKLLPTHSIFLGELGYDIALTFLQINKDEVSIWEKIKSSQDIVLPQRLDLWLLLTIFANENQNNYKNVINNILNL